MSDEQRLSDHRAGTTGPEKSNDRGDEVSGQDDLAAHLEIVAIKTIVTGWCQHNGVELRYI